VTIDLQGSRGNEQRSATGRVSLTRLATALVSAALVAMAFLVAPAAAHASLRAFHTPSGNIGCEAYGRYLRCDIGRKSWHVKPLPVSTCPLASGDSFTMTGTSRPYWTCHGDTALHLGSSLRYGSTWRSGPFTCASRLSGLTCKNRAGHGFFLSRQSYRTF
jgi:hypothetical protein